MSFGLELGSVWHRLGADVTFVEYLDRILAGMDLDTAKQSQRLFERQGLKFNLATKVTGVTKGANGLTLTLEPAAGGASTTLEADIVLVATGRVPYTNGLGLEEAGVVRDSRGRIEIDAHFQTNVPGIYAIGDVVKGPMLAHKARMKASRLPRSSPVRPAT